MLFFSVGIIFGIFTKSSAQNSAPQSNPVLTYSNGFWDMDWETVSGRTYFIQYSFNLKNWYYFPTVDKGDGTPLSYWFQPEGSDKFYVRLQFSDHVYSGDPQDGDIDGDGYSNGQEVAHGTDPSVFNSGPANPGGPNSPTYPNFPLDPQTEQERHYYLNVDVVGTGNDPSPPRRTQYALNRVFEILAVNGDESQLDGEDHGWPIGLPVSDDEEITLQVIARFPRDNERTIHILRHEVSLNPNTNDEVVTLESFDFTIDENQPDSDEEVINEGLDGTDPTRNLYAVIIRQNNFPTSGGNNDATDMETNYFANAIFSRKAFITGQPAVPQLRSEILGFEGQVNWQIQVRSERPMLRGTLDDRNFPNQGWVNIAGNQSWDIEEAMQGEFVGGNCTLNYQATVQDGQGQDVIETGNREFLLRGKNPLDADSLAYINANIGQNFVAYAWGMVRHESRQGNNIYNQFNTQNNIEGTLNFGGPDGWGIAQIDRRSNRQIPGTNPPQYRPPDYPGLNPDQYTTTAETWNWNDNVTAMSQKLNEKRTTYITFINRFRNAYGNNNNWVEPPQAHTIGDTTLPAEAWGGYGPL